MKNKSYIWYKNTKMHIHVGQINALMFTSIFDMHSRSGCPDAEVYEPRVLHVYHINRREGQTAYKIGRCRQRRLPLEPCATLTNEVVEFLKSGAATALMNMFIT